MERVTFNAKFEETHLGYTQERLDRVLRAFNCYQNAAINIAQVNIKVGFIGRQVFLTTSNDIGSGLHPSLRSFCPQKVIRRRAGLIFLKRSCLKQPPKSTGSIVWKLARVRASSLDLMNLDEDQIGEFNR